MRPINRTIIVERDSRTLTTRVIEALDAGFAPDEARQYRDQARAWAESPDPPDGPDTKSAMTWAGEAEASAQSIVGDAQRAEDARDAAEGWRDGAWAAASQAEQDRIQTGQDRAATGDDRIATGQDRQQTGQDRVATGQDRGAAETARDGAEDARDLAKDWASKPEDQVVDAGEYSAKHYAAKAGKSAADAEDTKEGLLDDLTVEATTLDPAAPAYATWDGVTQKLVIGVPQGVPGEAEGAVMWDQAQQLSGGEQQQARENIGLGSAASADAGDFATAAQGVKADTSLQPGAKIPVTDITTGAAGPIVVGRVGSTGAVGTISLEYTAIAETVPRRGVGGIVAVGTPTGPTHATPKSYVDDAIGDIPPQANADWNAGSGLAEIKNKPTLGDLAAKDKAHIATDTEGVLPINRGGTNATAVAQARGNLGLTYASTAEAEDGTAANRVMSPARTTHAIEQKAVLKSGDTGIGGYSAISKNLGNLSGTVTIAPTGGNIQHANNNGAATIAAPTSGGVYTIIVEITNTGSAGTLTLTGFDDVDGDDLSTDNRDKFLLYVTKTSSSKTAIVKALQ